MKKTKMFGGMCVGDWRLAPIDVGFDVREQGMSVVPPTKFSSVGIEQKGKVYLVEGTRDEMIRAVRAAGYTVAA